MTRYEKFNRIKNVPSLELLMMDTGLACGERL